jgi:heme-degrading monooxygenase HmoA
MLAMHYRIPLSGAEAVAAVERRARERGPLFDGMPGLAHKFFLVDPVHPTYATFYLWQEAEAAHAFVTGPLFAALVEAFGRPEVRLLLTTAIDLPRTDPDGAVLVEGLAADAHGPRIDAIDPRDGAHLSLHFDDSIRGQRFRVPYHAQGTDATFRPALALP